MKKLYEMPAIELTKFDVEDVITASSALGTDSEFVDKTVVDVTASWNSNWDSQLSI